MNEELDANHERQVDTFLRAAAEKEVGEPIDDKAFHTWLKRHRHPVLTERELEWRRGHEVGFTEQSLTTGMMTAAGRPPVSIMADIFGRRVGAPVFGVMRTRAFGLAA